MPSSLDPLQFAVVREDPRLELDLLRATPSAHALLVASAGDTAFALRAHLPSLRITLVDPNPAQLAHVVTKEKAWLAGAPPATFNVGSDDPSGLSECGNFEALFRQLRSFLHTFVAPRETFQRLFDEPVALLQDVPRIVGAKYWPVAFELFFSDSMLHAMFGPAATQHAVPGSYPAYFRGVIERGLAGMGAFINPFLHHVLLGQYSERRLAWPEFLLAKPRALRAEIVAGTFDAVPSFEPFDFVDLSNILDWSDRATIERLARRLVREMRPRTRVLWRELNNDADPSVHFRDAFAFDDAQDRRLLQRERSLFYGKIRLGTRLAEHGA